jgi:7-cyano-7-deazaguanine synthase
MAEALGGDPLVALTREATHSCYAGDREHRHDWGYGCDACPACDLRARGWEAYSAARAPR